jgi:hypothetical protein
VEPIIVAIRLARAEIKFLHSPRFGNAAENGRCLLRLLEKRFKEVFEAGAWLGCIPLLAHGLLFWRWIIYPRYRGRYSRLPLLWLRMQGLCADAQTRET